MKKVIEEAIDKLINDLLYEFNNSIPGHSISYNTGYPDVETYKHDCLLKGEAFNVESIKTIEGYSVQVREHLRNVYGKYTLGHSIRSFKLPKKGDNQYHMSKLDDWRIKQNDMHYSKTGKELCNILNNLVSIKNLLKESKTEAGLLSLLNIINAIGTYKQNLYICKQYKKGQITQTEEKENNIRIIEEYIKDNINELKVLLTDPRGKDLNSKNNAMYRIWDNLDSELTISKSTFMKPNGTYHNHVKTCLNKKK